MRLVDLLSQHPAIASWTKGLDQPSRTLLLGLSGASKSLVFSCAYEQTKGKLVILTSSQNEAEKLASDLAASVGGEQVYTFFTDDSPVAEFLFSSIDRTQSRISALEFLLDERKKGILVASVAACRVLLPHPTTFLSARLTLRIGQEIEIKKLVSQLDEMGYKKVSRVFNQGEFSQRGDIMDIFPLTEAFPYRLEFFGDEVDGVRVFDVDTQKSLENRENLFLSPASEMIFTPADYQRAEKNFAAAKDTAVSQEQASYLEELRAECALFRKHPDSSAFRSLYYEAEWTLLDYLPAATPIIVDDMHKIADKHAQFDKELAEYVTQELQKGKTLSHNTYFASAYLRLRSYTPSTYCSTFQKGVGNLRFEEIYSFNQHSMQEFFNQIPLLKEELARYAKSGYTVILQANSDHSLQNLQKTLEEYELYLPAYPENQLVKGQQQLTVGSLSAGFHFLDEKLVVITERELFNRKIKPRVRRKQMSNAERLKHYNELAVGDYVVHHVHGIGKYLGIETITVGGVHRDYLTIHYQNTDRISIPVDQLDSLSKYMASDGKTPKLNALNDGRFQRTKQKVQKQVEDIADDLIKLYAERSQLKGFAFSTDDASQEEFDNYFTHVETEDQLRSIQEIKKDMEKDRPMDRLLVGDVGFGKTEVAMRAAFKAVNDGKQVAILVPTTVLAQQHFATFQERFVEFPVTVEVVSRFKTKQEQKLILEKVKKGQVDILIGTHRLLSKDVVFADLGLLVIDEEQRFGVKHKERLKELKKKIDVLTLTATPIPRTLQMSMLGIRDLSVIETPPTNRYPVQTYVLESNREIIRDAILRERDRGGQVYYLYNKVDTIEQKVAELQELVPEVSIGFVHGQLSEIQLENTLLAFVEGEYDVLVTTTIIETGVDIPNANTLFIENADHLGLSTLYQLRGRVGRSNRIAYAYLLYRPDKSLTEVAEKRLEAIKGFTELGSGFKIAMQDLSIRGAGNILGAAQSGFIDSVGYELYSQLLEQAILEKQGKAPKREKSHTEINLGLDAYIPSDYIADQRQKIEIYKRINQIDSRVTYQELQDELIDRFGDYPDTVAYLLEIGLIKCFLDRSFAKSVIKKDGKLLVTFEQRAGQRYLTQDYFQALSATTFKAALSEENGSMQILFDSRGKKDFLILEQLLLFSESLYSLKKQDESI